MANVAEKDYGSDPIMWADYRTPSAEYTGRSLGLKGIAEGYVDDPSVTQMRGMLGAAGRQQLGAARSADMASGAARGRLGRGAQQQTQLMAPGMVDALKAQTQQAAQQQQLGRVGYQRGQRQRQMEARRNAEMAAVLGQESELAAEEQARGAGMSAGAMQGAAAGSSLGPWGALFGGIAGAGMGYYAEDGGVVPGDKDEAVPVIAHGGEVILPEDVSKKLLKALSSKELKGKKKAPQERPLLTDRLQPPPSLDRANVVYAEDVKDQYPGWVENTPGQTWHTGSYDDTPSWLLNQWREQRDAGLPRAGGEQKKWLEAREGGPFRENRLPEFLEHNLRGYSPVGRHHVPYESREAKIEEMKTNALSDLDKRLSRIESIGEQVDRGALQEFEREKIDRGALQEFERGAAPKVSKERGIIQEFERAARRERERGPR